MDEQDVLGRLASEWEGLPGEDAAEALPECFALVRISKGFKFEPCKFPPKSADGAVTYEAYPQLVGRIKVIQASHPLAVGYSAWVRLDFPPKGYEGLDSDQVEMRAGTVKRFMSAVLAGDVKGDEAKKARVTAVITQHGGKLGEAVVDKEAIVKITQYKPQSGEAKNRFNAWYPATPANMEKYLHGTVAGGTGGTEVDNVV